MGITEKRLMTAEDLARLGDYPRYELIEGVLREMTRTSRRHSRIGARLAALVGAFVSEHGLGETTGADGGYLVHEDPDTVLVPDLGFIAQERADADEDEDFFFRGAPDLAVEVVSPSDRPREVRRKAQEWLEAGSRIVWVVWPKTREVEVYRRGAEVRVLHEGDALDGEDVLPGFRCRVSEVFRR